MIQLEYIVDDNKSLLTILFDNVVIKHMKAKCDDYVNFLQMPFKANHLTLFKADTGYRITRAKNKKKTYQVIVRHPLREVEEFENIACTYYLKNNGLIRIVIP